MLVATTCSDVQPNKCLASPRHTCNKANLLLFCIAGLINELLNAKRRNTQIDRSGVEACNSFDRMLSVKRAGSLNDCRRRMIGSAFPHIGVDHRSTDLLGT